MHHSIPLFLRKRMIQKLSHLVEILEVRMSEGEFSRIPGTTLQ